MINPRECGICSEVGESDEMAYCTSNGCYHMICADCYVGEVYKTTGKEIDVDQYDAWENDENISCRYCNGDVSPEEIIEHACLLLNMKREDLILSAKTAKKLLK